MALKTFRVIANVPGEFKQLVAQRVHEEHYHSVSAYVNGLIFFDLYSRRHHWLTGALMKEPQWVRDQVVIEIVRDFDKHEEKSEGWFEKRIAELIEEKRKAYEASAN